MELKVIARIYNDFNTKFGIPRQSSMVKNQSTIVFEKEYRDDNALRGLDGYNYVWLIWGFDKAEREKWTPCVRPPRLGGNTKMGDFATRSPFRPNSLGLSSVKIDKIVKTENKGTILIVSGADMLNNTPIYDIKPYLPFTDVHGDATSGFALDEVNYRLDVEFDKSLLNLIEENKQQEILDLLSLDPRPSYIDDEERIYGFTYGNYEIKFSVKNKTLTVKNVELS